MRGSRRHINFELQSTFNMKKEQDYFRDLVEIRSMMERSSKFLSLSGWAGVMAGIYALIGSYLAYYVLDFRPEELSDPSATAILPDNFGQVVLLALVMLILAISTAIFLSSKNAIAKGEKAWNATSKRMIYNMAVPLITGGLLILIFISKGWISWIIPLSLIFYGLSLYNASKFTFGLLKYLGLIQIGLGLVAACLIEYAVLLWAIGFGVFHIIYGVYMHIRYER